MRAMILDAPGQRLRLGELPVPTPGPGQVLLRVRVCGLCRTDLHIVNGELKEPKLPLVLGHQIIAEVAACGAKAERFAVGERVGVPWLGETCGACRYCLSRRENLCPSARFTGYQKNGGFAEMCIADERFVFPVAKGFADFEAAPLLCAGLIGYRAFKLAGDCERLGLYGFGAAAHILIQVARSLGKQVYAFTRPGDEAAQRFALNLGAVWAGSSDGPAPQPLDAAILFAPVGSLVPQALAAVSPGGTVVCGGIHMSDIPSFPYELLWGERVLRSVANLTRADAEEFLQLAPKVPVRTEVTAFPLEQANAALDWLASGRGCGAAVLTL